MPSRRQVLATTGAALLSGCSRLQRFTDDDRRSPPASVQTEPTDWEYPDYDPANTNAAPGDAAPNTIAETPDWTAEFAVSAFVRATRPVVANGIVYLALKGIDQNEEFERLVAIDAQTGEVQWRFQLQESSYGYPPTVTDDTVLWLASTDTVHALNPADGSVRWRRAGVNHTAPLAAHGLVLIAGGTHTDPVLEALDPRTGTPHWTRDEGGRNWRLVAADDEAFYVTLRSNTHEEEPELHALDPVTGESLWSSSRIAPRTAALNSSYLFASTGPPDAKELIAFDTATQNAKWTVTRDLQRDVSDSVANGGQSVAAVTDELVLTYLDFPVSFPNHIEARDTDSGDVVWSVTGDGDELAPDSRPVIVGDRVYVMSRPDADEQSTPTLRILDLQDGSERKRVELPPSESEKFVVTNRQLFVTTSPSMDTVRLTVR